MKREFLYIKPQEELYKIGEEVETPAIVYDLDQLEHTINRMKNDIKIVENAELNFALKASYNQDILNIIKKCGLGCDVASRGEAELALRYGIKKITTTAPYYSKDDMRFFYQNDIVMDLDSIEQIKQFGEMKLGDDIGLRIKISMLDKYDNGGSFGSNSRFGVDILDENVMETINNYNLNVKRLHVHTGQMTPDALMYKIKYLLSIAEYFDEIETLDLGGGFFYLYKDRLLMIETLKIINTYIKEWNKNNSRNVKIDFEPGGAIVTPSGYLVTKVISVKENTSYKMRIVTVDSSAWNIAPWHKPNVIKLDETNDDCGLRETLIAGNSLYELDFFGNEHSGVYDIFNLGEVEAGNVFIMSMVGGYTITNSRKFNLLPIPKEYTLKSGVLKECNQ